MTDIWDEKPEAVPVGWGAYLYYPKPETDAWLEKVKAELDKLEAVKTHLTTWVSGHSDWQMGRISQWKKELDEILEGEG